MAPPRSTLFIPFAMFLAVASTAGAQDYDRPPAGFSDDNAAGDRGAVDMPDNGGLGIRLGKLETRIREMTGQIEELQNNNRKLVEQLQKFQADIESRLAGSGTRQRRSEAEPPVAAGAAVPSAAEQGGGKRSLRRGDAFDPETASGDSPGKPKPLGSTASGQPDVDTAKGPMDLAGSRLSRGADTQEAAAAPRASTAVATANPGAAPAQPITPRGEFDSALAQYRDKQYEQAEKSFSAFIQKNPKSRLAADATYYLGESFAQRGRSREAAEQYLKISTEYATSSRAPDALLHLGMSLKALGAKEQACATFAEVGRKYPNAPAYVRNGAERESKRAQC